MSRKLSEQGYFGTRSGSAGNVSVMVENETAMVVTPTQLSYDVMTVDDICVVDFDHKEHRGPTEAVDRSSDACGGVSDATRC